MVGTPALDRACVHSAALPRGSAASRRSASMGSPAWSNQDAPWGAERHRRSGLSGGARSNSAESARPHERTVTRPRSPTESGAQPAGHESVRALLCHVRRRPESVSSVTATGPLSATASTITGGTPERTRCRGYRTTGPGVPARGSGSIRVGTGGSSATGSGAHPTSIKQQRRRDTPP